MFGYKFLCPRRVSRVELDFVRDEEGEEKGFALDIEKMREER